MLRSVLGKILWERRAGMIWWVGGLSSLAMLTIAFVPTIRDSQDSVQELFEELPQGVLALFGSSDIAELLTPVGVLNSRLYASVGAILVISLAISIGTRAIAGDEEAGRLELLLAHPIPRSRIVLDAVGAMVILVGIVALVLAIILLITNPIYDLELSIAGIVAANVGVVLLAVLHGCVALAVGALTGRRSITIGVSAAVVVAGFFLNGLSEAVPELNSVAEFLPFRWYLKANPLATGFDWPNLALLTLVTAVLVAIAIVAFDRRDISK